MKRQPYRAGSFYEADPVACRRSAEEMLDAAAPPADLPAVLMGGLVPHAGWVFSGRTAALTLKALAERGRLRRVVVFGADHWGICEGSAMYERGSWRTPLGEVRVDEALADALAATGPPLRMDRSAHAREHSIEVQLPLMQALSPDVQVVPISVSPGPEAVQVGRAVGRVLAQRFPEASVVGSTDLTHYGPQYGFSPGGRGRAGLDWAKENDRRMLKIVEAMRAEKVVEEAAARQNACGAGAIAATVAACAEMGATRGIVLEHTTSAEVMERLYHAPGDDAVGYAAVVFA